MKHKLLSAFTVTSIIWPFHSYILVEYVIPLLHSTEKITHAFRNKKATSNKENRLAMLSFFKLQQKLYIFRLRTQCTLCMKHVHISTQQEQCWGKKFSLLSHTRDAVGGHGIRRSKCKRVISCEYQNNSFYKILPKCWKKYIVWKLTLVQQAIAVGQYWCKRAEFLTLCQQLC